MAGIVTDDRGGSTATHGDVITAVYTGSDGGGIAAVMMGGVVAAVVAAAGGGGGCVVVVWILVRVVGREVIAMLGEMLFE